MRSASHDLAAMSFFASMRRYLIGMGSAFDMSGSVFGGRYRRLTDEEAMTADREAIRGDFEAVFGDIRRAMDRVDHDLRLVRGQKDLFEGAAAHAKKETAR